MARKVVVTKESESGRNQKFKDTGSGRTMNRQEFVHKIVNDKYPDYHVRRINGVLTPVSNPDKKKGNNLG